MQNAFRVFFSYCMASEVALDGFGLFGVRQFLFERL